MLEDDATAFRVEGLRNGVTQGSSFVATAGLICGTRVGVL